MNEKINSLLNEYKETERCLMLGMEWLPNNDFAKAKLEVVRMIVKDLERLEKNQYLN